MLNPYLGNFLRYILLLSTACITLLSWRTHWLSGVLACIIQLSVPIILLVPFAWEKHELVETNNTASVLTINCRYTDQVSSTFPKQVLVQNADVVLLQEVTHRMVDTLETVLPSTYPYRLLHPHRKYGLAVYSRWPLQFDTAFCAPRVYLSWHFAQVLQVQPPHQSPFRIVNLRLTSPAGGFRQMISNPKQIDKLLFQQQEYLNIILEYLNSSPPQTTLLGGDFNASPGSTIYRRLMASFYDLAQNQPSFWQGTFGLPPPFSPVVLRTDWFLASAYGRVPMYEHTPFPDTDHQAVRIHWAYP